MEMFQGSFPPNYQLNTDTMQCGCSPDPFKNIDPKTRKIMGLIVFVSTALGLDYSAFKKWQDDSRDEWAIDEYIYIVTKKLMEMSEDEFKKYQANYRDEIRRNDKDGNKSSNTDRKTRSGESYENLFHEDGGTNF